MNASVAPSAGALRSRQIVWAALLLGAVLGAVAAGFLAFEAREIRGNQLARVALYARTLDDQAAAVVSGTETILRALQAPVEQPDIDTARLGALFADSLRGRPFLRSISLLDAGGRVLASSSPANAGVSVAPALLAAPGAPDRSTRLAPLAAGRDLRDLRAGPLATAPVLALPLVLPLQSAGRRVLLVALVNPDFFANQFERTLDGTALRGLLLGLDSRLIVGTAAVTASAGSAMPQLPAFAQHLPAHEFASDVGLGSDGAQAISAFRTTRQWPLVVLVEQPYAAFLSELLATARWALGFLLAAWVLLAGVTWTTRRTLLHDEQLGAELHAAHAATKASESRKLAILQSSLDGIVTVDATGRLLDFNPAAERMFGRTSAEVLGQSMAVLHIPPPVLQGLRDGMARYLARGEEPLLNRRIEVETQRADGSLFPVELTVVPVRTQTGQMFTATLRDITQRKQAEQALRDSEARARATFEQAAVGVLQQAVDRRFLRVNQTLCKLLGYTEAEFLALDADALIHPSDVDAGLLGMRRLFAGELSSFAEDKRYRRKDGSLVWVRLTASLARDDQGRALYMIGIVEDISARRRFEEELDAARQRELQVGARIQQSLLVTAPPPDIAGLQISSHNQASQGIDGDFVEVIRVGPDCVDLITGDVMGKGLAAAMMGAATKLQFSRSIAELVTAAGNAGALPRPAAVVAAVHRAMTPALQALEAFVTLCYLRIDTRRNTVTWVGCGHEETLRIAADGVPELLANQHPPLGVLDGADYVEDERPLGQGEALFLCSDGVTDALRPDGERVGRDRVVDAVIRRMRLHTTPAAVLHSLRCDLLSDGVQLQDDLTMVVVQRPPAGPAMARIELPVQLQALRQVRGFIAAQTAAAGLDEAECGLLEVACVEAFTNIVRHADGLLPGAPIELVASHGRDALVIDLVHLGEPFTPPADPPDTDFSVFPEGGFGLQIIHGASDEVQYLFASGVNTLRMTKRVTRHTGAPGS